MVLLPEQEAFYFVHYCLRLRFFEYKNIIYMETKQQKTIYHQPSIKVVSFMVESGFAVSLKTSNTRNNDTDLLHVSGDASEWHEVDANGYF